MYQKAPIADIDVHPSPCVCFLTEGTQQWIDREGSLKVPSYATWQEDGVSNIWNC